MKIRAAHFFLVLVLAALVTGVTGCASTDPENVSARPWDSAEGWDTGALGNMMNDQHR